MPANDIQIVVLMIVFAVCLLIVAVFFFLLIEKYRRILEKRQMEALNNLIIGQDNERERLSRDLHDQIGPQINAVAMLVSSVRSGNAEDSETLKELTAELWQVQDEVRNISHDLMSSSLIKYGLINAIKKLAERNKQAGLQINITHNTDGSQLSERQLSHMFSVVKELLQNTRKHSGATEVHMDFNFDPAKKRLHFSYRDNGRGVGDSSKISDGIGLSNIKTRVKLMNGQCNIRMQEGFKTDISIDTNHGNG